MKKGAGVYSLNQVLNRGSLNQGSLNQGSLNRVSGILWFATMLLGKIELDTKNIDLHFPHL